MDFDISRILERWDYQPGQVTVRRFKGKDGKDKIQLRVDLGLLQMNALGRPDGKRPFGRESLFEHYQAKLHRHVAAHHGSDEGYKLKAEDCARLQLESLQYHHRYICLLQLEDYAGVIQDAERNLEVFEFVGKHAESEELAWSLQQFEPQLLMILTRARAMQAMEAGNFAGAIGLVERGIEDIREFYENCSRSDLVELSGEIRSLAAWLSEIRAKRPLSTREKLEQTLHEAVEREDYERAAQLRDALRKLQSHP